MRTMDRVGLPSLKNETNKQTNKNIVSIKGTHTNTRMKDVCN
jgi:hypothetical protein